MMIPLVGAAGSEKLGFDFRRGYLPAAESVRVGGSPYVSLETEAADGRLPYVYPPQLAIALVPLTALPVDVAAVLAFLGSLAALIGALAVVGVRDVRCYAAVLVWAPGWNALEMANVSAALALALALAWRFRATIWRLAILLGLAISTKLFLWPLLAWAIATRRFRAAGLAAAIGLVVSLTAWAAIGFEGLISYPDQLGRIQVEDSYSIVAMATRFGYEPNVGHVLMAIVGVALLGAMVNFGRHGDDFRAFTCAIAAALAVTPVVWQHYLVLFAVPLALARPRFSVIWLLPIVLWVSPRVGNGDGLEPFMPAFVVLVLLVVLLARPRDEAPLAQAPRTESVPATK
jgi:hypothetical protein